MINLASSDFQGKIDDVSIFVGVLDIQGSVEEHIRALQKLGIHHRAVKTKMDIEKIDGLIIPGGESTTIGKLMQYAGLDTVLRKRVKLKNPRPLSIWGTCAGGILLAKKVINSASTKAATGLPASLGLMDIEIERNSYGRQMDSFEVNLDIPFLGKKKIPAVFIRAPRVKKATPQVEILAQYAGSPVMLRQKNCFVTMFHPELTSDLRVHRYFISIVQHYASSQ